MPVTDITTDRDALTMTLEARFDAPVERLWRAFTEPAQLERFWGPPGWPATFAEFDFRPGGRAFYRMTSPTGEVTRGAWEFLSIDPQNAFEVLDGFVDENGQALEGMPSMRMTFTFAADGEGSRLANTTHLGSLDALEQMLAMGAEEGTTMAFDQLDTVLRGLRDFAQGRGTDLEVLDDTLVRITRLIDAPRETVWHAYVTPDLMRRWLLGPDGWRMTVAELSLEPGGANHQAWEPEEGTEGEAFAFVGETLYVEPGRRLVTTETMEGTEGPPTTNDLSFYEEDGATLLTLLITYPDASTRDAILATGMVDGMEDSYARLERVLAG